jgi:branched-chain amino acid transport system ATP-binding protein
MLEIFGLNVCYGNIHAVKDVSISVQKGEFISLLGANGAGKSTILKTLSGLMKPRSGKIICNGKDITGADPKAIALSGMIQVPEGRQIFTGLTVFENLKLGAYLNRDAKTFQSNLEWVFQTFPIIKERQKQIAGTLSGGEQQMLAIGRALMGKPELLLLDEPSLGLAPVVTDVIFDVIKELKSRGMTILLVEQNAYQALEISDRAYVLETGAVKLEGNSRDLMNNPEVKKAYLGG